MKLDRRTFILSLGSVIISPPRVGTSTDKLIAVGQTPAKEIIYVPNPGVRVTKPSVSTVVGALSIESPLGVFLFNESSGTTFKDQLNKLTAQILGYSGLILLDSPSVYCRMGDFPSANSTIFADSSPSKRNLVGGVIGSVLFGQAGLLVGDVQACCNFNGNTLSSYTSTPLAQGSFAFRSGPGMSFEGWMLSNPSSQIGVVTGVSNAPPDAFNSLGCGFTFGNSLAKASLRIGDYSLGAGTFVQRNSSAVPILGAPYHICGIFDRVNATYPNIYTNAVLTNGTTSGTGVGSGTELGAAQGFFLDAPLSDTEVVYDSMQEMALYPKVLSVLNLTNRYQMGTIGPGVTLSLGGTTLNGTTGVISISQVPVMGITGDMSIEMLITPTSVASACELLSRATGGIAAPYRFGINAGGTLFAAFGNGTTQTQVNGTLALTAGALSYVQIVKSGTNITFFINGVAAGSSSIGAQAVADGGNATLFGARNNNGLDNYFTGKLSLLVPYASALSATSMSNHRKAVQTTVLRYSDPVNVN